MSLESATKISELIASNPTGTDPKSQGDDHLRMIKAVMQNNAIKSEIGQSATPANNFSLDASADNGTMKLARASGQDVMTVAADGKVAFPKGVTTPVYSGTLASSGIAAGVTPLPLTDEFSRGFTRVGTKLYPLEPGYYNITGGMTVDSVGPWLGGLLRKNGTTLLTQQIQAPYSTQYAVVSMASMDYFDGVNDYVELCVNHTAASGTVSNARMTIAKVSG